MLSDLIDKVVDKLTGANMITALLLLATALGAALIAYWRVAEKKSFAEFFEFAIPKEVILHPSARADALFWITKRLVMPFLLIPSGVIFVTAIAFATNQLLATIFGINAPLIEGPASPITVIIFTITMVLAYDLSYYLYHKAQHAIPFLWELHKVHHSAEVLVGITKDRVHPLDDLMNRAWDGVIPGICFGIWTLITLDPVEATIFGINVYVIRNILMMDFVRHTHFKISFGPMDKFVLSPHWHQLHHSVDPNHYDKNFGLLLSVWDRMFGTAMAPKPDEDFKFGLMDRDVRDYQSLWGLYVLPLQKMWRILAKRFSRRPAASQTPQESTQP